MKSLDRLVPLVGVGVLMQACATQQPAGTVTAAKPAATPVTPAVTSAAGAAAPNRVVLHDDTLTELLRSRYGG